MVKIKENKEAGLLLAIDFYSDNDGRAFSRNRPSDVNVFLIDTKYEYESGVSLLHNFDNSVLQRWTAGKATNKREAMKIGRAFIRENSLKLLLMEG